MIIENVSFFTTEWGKVPPVEVPGETGMASWRTVEAGNLRVRMVEYTPGYRADHWCERGHVLLVLEGELVTSLRDGREIVLAPGSSFQVGEGAEPHLTSSPRGARVFIVD
ncbi:DHCW motif cupin fold protein [Sorangium sp. So ce134]